MKTRSISNIKIKVEPNSEVKLENDHDDSGGNGGEAGNQINMERLLKCNADFFAR